MQSDSSERTPLLFLLQPLHRSLLRLASLLGCPRRSSSFRDLVQWTVSTRHKQRWLYIPYFRFLSSRHRYRENDHPPSVKVITLLSPHSCVAPMAFCRAQQTDRHFDFERCLSRPLWDVCGPLRRSRCGERWAALGLPLWDFCRVRASGSGRRSLP
jgi:hypothetical protein